MTLLDIHRKKVKSLSQRDIFTPVSIATLFIISNAWKQLNCPNRRVGQRLNVMHTQIEYYSAVRNEKIFHLQQDRWTLRALW